MVLFRIGLSAEKAIGVLLSRYLTIFLFSLFALYESKKRKQESGNLVK